MDGRLRNMTSVYIYRDNAFLMLFRQGGRVVNDVWISSAGGHFEKEELNDAKACVLRELREELNITENMLEKIQLRYITLKCHAGEIRQNYYFFAELKKDAPGDFVSNEGKLAWFAKDELMELEMPYTARFVIEHYLKTGAFNEKLYGGIADGEKVTMIEMPDDTPGTGNDLWHMLTSMDQEGLFAAPAGGYEIVPLPKETWKGAPIPLVVESDEYYDVRIEKQADGCSVRLVKQKAEPPIRHFPEEYDFPDSLYQDHWEKARAWGIVAKTADGKQLLACIETCPEEWSNRLMVTELWVHEKLRRKGIGHRLMDIAKRQAMEENRRVLMLETQSCNAGAIAFYLHEGFTLIGFDSCCYTNNDIARREVRLDLGIIFEGFPDGKRLKA